MGEGKDDGVQGEGEKGMHTSRKGGKRGGKDCAIKIFYLSLLVIVSLRSHSTDFRRERECFGIDLSYQE